MQKARAADAAAARGLAALEAARAKLAPFADLDARVAEHQAGLLRAGDDANPAALPPGMLQARRARAAALELLADAERAHGLLDGEAKAAQAQAETAAAAVRAAVFPVMYGDAAALVTQLREHELQAGKLRALVGALVGNRAPVDPSTPWSLDVLLHDRQHAPLIDAANLVTGRAAAAWQEFRKALALDADAVLQQP